MDPIKDSLKRIKETERDSGGDDLMLNPEYLRHSSAIISEALQKGFDVLQLENGDVVTTGTRVIVTQYRWDTEQQKMSKLTAKERKQMAQEVGKEEELEEA